MITRPLTEDVMARAAERYDVTARRDTAPMDGDELSRALSTHEALLCTIGDPLTEAVIAAADPLVCRVTANFGVGHDHIDVAAAREAGLTVTNTPGVVTDATADTALMLLLMAARRAGEAERIVRAGRWEGWHPTQLLGRHVTGARLGVVGMGRIGRAVAARAHRGFGMEVVFHNRSRVEDAGVPARQLDGLEAVLAAADMVVLTVPGGPQTRGLIDAGALAAMRPGAVLVNVSRGDVIDEPALAVALREGPLAAAGLDVHADEPRVSSDLAALENVVLLPHVGTATEATRSAMGHMALDNIDAVLDGRAPPNAV